MLKTCLAASVPLPLKPSKKCNWLSAACGRFYILHGYSSLTFVWKRRGLLVGDDSGERTKC